MDPFSLMGLFSGGASALGGLAGLFGGHGKNPADEANRYLSQIPGQVSPYYQPYINAGQGALGTLQGQYGQLLNDPGALFNKLGQGYTQSPGYQFALKQALQQGTNASARGGMLGTPQDQQWAMETTQGLAAKDYNDYIKHILGLYRSGLSGEQGLNTQGYDASSSLGNLRGSVLGQQASNAYAGQAGLNSAHSQDLTNILSGLGTAGAGYYGGPAVSKYLQNASQTANAGR